MNNKGTDQPAYHGAGYITHFYCLVVEAGFYSDMVECLPVDPATWVRFPAGAGKIFSLYDNGAHRAIVAITYVIATIFR